MPVLLARPVRLAAAQRHRLKRVARGHKSPYRDKLRAQIVLDAARGHVNARIARQRQVTEDTVRKWRGRFAAEGFGGLADRARSGRPPRFTPVQVAEVEALACQLPAESGVPLSRWTCPELAYEAEPRGVVERISASTIRRWLASDALKPRQYRSWISIRDPNFRAKATRVLDLYQGSWDGTPLGPDEYVISSDKRVVLIRPVVLDEVDDLLGDGVVSRDVLLRAGMVVEEFDMGVGRQAVRRYEVHVVACDAWSSSFWPQQV
ncbi:MAG: hypothetical protein QOE61_548 [Micromonosporaceae bacterium]|nr:hypothetical protein [Micromonosporaceae bacterium]